MIVGGGAVHRLGGPLRRHRKGEADDAAQQVVEIVLVLRLLGLYDLGRGLAGHEFCVAALGQVAGEFGVPIILELLDLVGRPALRHADERVGDGAFGEIIELPELAARLTLLAHLCYAAVIFFDRNKKGTRAFGLTTLVPAAFNPPEGVLVRSD